MIYMAKNYAIMFQRGEFGYNQILKDLFLSHPYLISALFVLSIIGLLVSIITPLIISSLIDNVLIGLNLVLLPSIIISLIIIYFISALSNYLSSYVRGKLNALLFNELSVKIFDTIQERELWALQQLKIGDLQSRTINNANVVVLNVTTIIPQIVTSILGVFLPFGIMLSLNPTLTLEVMAPVLLFGFSAWFFGGRIKTCQRHVLDANANLQSFLKEAYSIVPLVKAFGLEDWAHRKYVTQISNYYTASLGVVKVTSMQSALSILMYGVPFILLLTLGSLAVLEGSISIGTLTAFMAYIGLFFSPIQQLSSLWTTYKGSQASYDRIKEISSLQRDEWGEMTPSLNVSKIELKDIWFSYGNRAVLQGLSATFVPGINYLIGDNGSGKSTVAKLLLGLYRPDQGKILLNDNDFAQISQETIRSMISVVFCDNQIFDGTIRENILIGNLLASQEDVIQVAKKVKIHDFVVGLPKKYETEVGEAGFALSSGEKQKIALARVILKNAPIIIFDEFTNSIDIESKKVILSTIRQLKDKIIIIITHDMDDLEGEYKCIYMHQGARKNIHSSDSLSRREAHPTISKFL